jgi:hypothetical protein
MLRFSDRLTSTSSTVSQVKPVLAINDSSDETESKSSTPTADQEYNNLVELIGLHQTVKVLEAEYSLVAGGNGKLNNALEVIFGYSCPNFPGFYSSKNPTHSTLMKRASELRDILGLAKCSALLSCVLAQQYTKPTVDLLVEKQQIPRNYERTPLTLRAEAGEWTPLTRTESPHNILQKVFDYGLNSDTTTCEMDITTLVPPSVEYRPMVPIHQREAYFIAPAVTKSGIPLDLTGDGKQFISYLSAKRDTSPAYTPQKPIGTPFKRVSPPPGLPIAPTQQMHAFSLKVLLLPQTFSVHILSTLHMRFQHVSAALEMLDSSFANEISKTGCTQTPVSTRWESWMSPAGAAGMSRALLELRKSLDELCGATARAGWIVDTWGAYQDGMLDSTKPSEPGLGSAAINGIELSGEGEMKRDLQAPIGRPSVTEKKKASSQVDGAENAESTKTPGGFNGKVIPALPMLRPPPGLAFPLSPLGNTGQPRDTAMMNGSTISLTTHAGYGGLNSKSAQLNDRIAMLKRTPAVSIATK